MRVLAVGVATSFAAIAGASSAAAQVVVTPGVEPTKNDGGWIYWIAIALFVLGVLAMLAIVFGYMRNAPRFQRDEGVPRSVKAPRLQPGVDAPRRPVNITGAPVVVPAPAVAVAVAAPAAAPAPAPAPAPAASAPAPAPAPTAAAPTPTPAPAAPPAEAAPAPAPAPAAPSGEHKEVALDQETFDRVLAELLEQGTTRRVAEGQARRAAMIAARKKAGG